MAPAQKRDIAEYLFGELNKQGDVIQSNNQERQLLSSALQEILKKILLEANEIAKAEHSEAVMPVHLEEATRIVLNK
ncbi:hypothetical protein NCAS_0A11780 [Naumovozyma castellii]|uniref:Centromere protein X n=1 Tax=Naumovozyma castellii TaxID=27288 RepID=G0V8D8_NAUCA|nr:hypothetical protein NCAS_0A11780 [Naumovozyma castellii CBS 4309]CCC67736.1 hypothetical protein NCAS_0A11780 [Naumovozyma castellii CBS 4309]